jgi:hypothetical protein
MLLGDVPALVKLLNHRYRYLKLHIHYNNIHFNTYISIGQENR